MLSHLIMPMAGAGSRFTSHGIPCPKPLIDLYGHPFFFWAVESVLQSIPVADIVFAVLQDHVRRFNIDLIIRSYYPSARIVEIPEILDGPATTCLEAVTGIHDDLPVVFNDCDHAFGCNAFGHRLRQSAKADFDGALLTFKHSSPTYSYVYRDDNGQVAGAIEKQAVSNDAICGAYVFRNAQTFRNAYANREGSGEPYLSNLYNFLCRKGMKVNTYPVEWHLDFGTPERQAELVHSPSAFRLLQNLKS